MDVEALLELISYKVVPLCFHTVAQAHEHLPIANDSLSRSRHAGMEASSAGDHLCLTRSLCACRAVELR